MAKKPKSKPTPTPKPKSKPPAKKSDRKVHAKPARPSERKRTMPF